MPEPALILITLGALLLTGLGGDLLARVLPLPRVTLLILAGIALGSPGWGVLPAATAAWYPLISQVALLMIGFLLGGKLSLKELAGTGRAILVISVAKVATVAAVTGLGLLLVGVPPVPALLLAGIAPATAPAAVTAVVQEMGAQGRFARTLLGIVALDDAWGLILFAGCLAGAQVLATGAGGLTGGLFALREVGGALLLGGLLGGPAALLTGRLRPGEPTQVEALGLVLLAGGLAVWLEVSPLLTAMAMGAVIVNTAPHHERPFHEIATVEWPFMVLFFVLAGARLEIEALLGAGGLLGAYVALRSAGILTGAALGAWTARAPKVMVRWLGPGLLPQAGVALGMAHAASDRLGTEAGPILAVVTAATVVFELVGPVLTRLAVDRAGAAA